MSLFDAIPSRMQTCGHEWRPGRPEPVTLWHVVPLGKGWGVAEGSVCARCAARDREGYRSSAEAWAEWERRGGQGTEPWPEPGALED